MSAMRNLTKIVIDGSPVGLCPPLCKNHFNGTLDAIAASVKAGIFTLKHLDVAGNDFTGTFPPELCTIKDCTAWGNHFASPARPKGCCDGLTLGGSMAPSDQARDEGEDEDAVGGYVCHPHDFPGPV